MPVGSLFSIAILVISSVSALLIRFSPWLNRRATKLAMIVFGEIVETRSVSFSQQRRLQSAFMGTPYHVYAAQTYLYATLVMVAVGVLGFSITLSLFGHELFGLDVFIQQRLGSILGITSFPTVGIVGRIVGVAIISGGAAVTAWVVTYRIRWGIPRVLADARAERIDLSTPRLVAFLYALARGGLEPPTILKILRDRHRDFGEAGRELAVSGKALEYFNVDSISAIRHVARRTPSDNFRIFTENFSSVLQSGRGLSTFLGDQYDHFQEEGEKQQALFLDRLGAIAEGYVALFVVGPLFLITVLLIFGLISGGTQDAMAAIVYGFIPLSNIAFIFYLDRTTRPFDLSLSSRIIGDEQGPSGTMDTPWTDRREMRTDGGLPVPRESVDRANVERLIVADLIQDIRMFVVSPLFSIRRRPTNIFFISVPIAGFWLLGNAYVQWRQAALTVVSIDDVLVISVIITLAPFAIAQRYHRIRRDEINNAVPDFLNRLASLNEAGLEIVAAFDQIRQSDLGPLSPELERVWTDITYGMDVETALYRMERRLRTPSVSQAITLIVNGMKSSSQIGPVLRIAAEEAHRIRSLRRDRQQEMSIYLVITYLSFFVFLTIVFVLIATFIPAIPSAEALEARGLTGRTAGITQVQVETFTMLLFHASLAQGFFSGLVGGQMSQGSIRYGAIHVVVLLGIAYFLFTVVI